MEVLRQGLVWVWRNKLTVVLLLTIAYLGLQRLGYLLSAPAISPGEAQIREPFPIDFALPDLQDQTIRLSNLRGRVVLLNFWATWCPPCRAEMPSMHALYQDYREKGFGILAISSDAGGKGVVAPFIEERGFTFPVLLDPRNIVGSRLRVLGIPTSYLLDKQGRIAGVEVGARNWNRAKVRQLLDRLLAEDGV
jgi:peroxiredoxin